MLEFINNDTNDYLDEDMLQTEIMSLAQSPRSYTILKLCS